ncbi:MAG: NUDIX domain-containing protein [Bacilli bacterium]|nr:NUDIX domain-containing protein [Bacilli bacterium]
MIFVDDFDLIKGKGISLEAEEKVQGDAFTLPYYSYNIIENKTGKIAGFAIVRIGSDYATTYIGNVDVNIYDNFRGNNYSLEVIKLLFKVFRFYELNSIYLSCDEQNYACRRVIELLGGQLLESAPIPDDVPNINKHGEIYSIYYLDIPPEGYENTVRNEHSSMSIVICGDKILSLTTSDHKVTLPKGHIEELETSLEASIRECYEETGVIIRECECIRELPSFSYSFSGSQFKNMRDLMFYATFGVCKINKTVDIHVFQIDHIREPNLVEIDNFLSCDWIPIEEFLYTCPYQDLVAAVNNALSVL